MVPFSIVPFQKRFQELKTEYDELVAIKDKAEKEIASNGVEDLSVVELRIGRPATERRPTPPEEIVYYALRRLEEYEDRRVKVLRRIALLRFTLENTVQRIPPEERDPKDLGFASGVWELIRGIEATYER